MLLGGLTALPASGSSSFSGDAPASGFCAILRPFPGFSVSCWRRSWKLPGSWGQRIWLPIPVPLKSSGQFCPNNLKGIGGGSGKTGERNVAAASHPGPCCGEGAETPNTPNSRQLKK